MDVLAWEDRRAACMLAGDVDGLDELLDERCVYVHSSGTSDTKASYLDKLRRGALAYTAIDTTDREVIEHEGCVLVVFRFDARALVGGAERHIDALCTAVWSRGDQPRLLAFQSTSLPA